ncbi:unnamed protein product [Rhizophagus irregularis]|nr:unnamed protein product [Rhizophagus irregularis]
MPYYNLLKKEIKSHQRKHRKGKTIDQKQNYCIQCYPVKSISADNIPDGFEVFWLWISIQYTAKEYTGATIAAFKVLKDEIASNAQSNILVSITTRIIQSIKFRQITTPLLELSFYLHKLFESTNGFKNLPTDIQVMNAYQLFHNIQPNNNMAISNAEMKAIFDGVFGNNGIDWKNSLTAIHNAAQATNTALTTLQTATANRATKIIEVLHFMDGMMKILMNGSKHFSKLILRMEGQIIEKLLLQLDILKKLLMIDRFLAYFATDARKNQWTRELQGIKQKEGESVEDYSRRF